MDLVFVFVFVFYDVRLLQPCGHLFGKRLTSWLFLCLCHFPIRCLGSGVVLDFIES